jgi:uncharacterized alkaline shock family protein YloU
MVEGTTTIKNEVLIKIAVGAAGEVGGVDQVGASSVGRTLARTFGGGRSSSSGVGVTPGQPGSGEAAFNLTISTQYGFSIPEVARAIRETVAQRISDLTGLTVRRVDIHVEDIREARAEGAASRFSFLGGEREAEKEKVQAPEFTEVPAA